MADGPRILLDEADAKAFDREQETAGNDLAERLEALKLRGKLLARDEVMVEGLKRDIDERVEAMNRKDRRALEARKRKQPPARRRK